MDNRVFVTPIYIHRVRHADELPMQDDRLSARLTESTRLLTETLLFELLARTCARDLIRVQHSRNAPQNDIE